jgi:hypothetical protein
LAILVVLGLIMNPGGFAAAGYAKASAGATQSSQVHRHKAHAHVKAAKGCHEAPSKSSRQNCKCCDKNSKCAHDGCACLKCVSLLADVPRANLGGADFPALHHPAAFVKPPGAVSQPPAPPPQS